MGAPEAAGLAADELVVVGSSAGGIEALSTLVASLPADFSAPLVFAQHLDPNKPSQLVPILERRSNLPVSVVRERTLLMPGTVCVVPANRHVTIHAGHVALEEDRAGRPRPSLDLLLSTAAADRRDPHWHRLGRRGGRGGREAGQRHSGDPEPANRALPGHAAGAAAHGGRPSEQKRRVGWKGAPMGTPTVERPNTAMELERITSRALALAH